MSSANSRKQRLLSATYRISKVRTLAVLVTLIVLPISLTANELNDKEIARAVSDALLLDAGVTAPLIDVAVTDGIVTLSGTVDNLLAKERGVRLAETVKGVRSIVDKMKIKAPERSDRQIFEDVQEVLLLDPVTESFQLGIGVEEGVVRLTGQVESWYERQLAGTVAKGVRGVVGVVNNVEVEYKQARSDEEIQAEIESLLKWDALVDHALIDVAVDNGKVTLTGTVGSAAEKRRAEQDTWVTGVEAVSTEGLVVASWARGQRFRASKYESKPDSAVIEAVEAALSIDPRVSAFDIDVEANDGLVTLSGEVDNLKAQRAASIDARNTIGVWSVRNRLKVRPGDAPSDARILENVYKAFKRDPYLNHKDIEIVVLNGRVGLSGEVNTYFQKAHADEEASAINGVVEVNNNIEVKDDYPVFTHDPYVDNDWLLDEYDWYAPSRDLGSRYTDWEVQRNIEDEIWWSPYVNSDEVAVEVTEGVATLTGTVDTWLERQRASKNAYEGGALLVRNKLKVRYGPEYYQP